MRTKLFIFSDLNCWPFASFNSGIIRFGIWYYGHDRLFLVIFLGAHSPFRTWNFDCVWTHLLSRNEVMIYLTASATWGKGEGNIVIPISYYVIRSNWWENRSTTNNMERIANLATRDECNTFCSEALLKAFHGNWRRDPYHLPISSGTPSRKGPYSLWMTPTRGVVEVAYWICGWRLTYEISNPDDICQANKAGELQYPCEWDEGEGKKGTDCLFD